MAKAKITDFGALYAIERRQIKYPRLEFKTGTLKLILPQNYYSELKLLAKHKKWIVKNSRLINDALLRSKNIQLERRSVSDLRQLIRDYCKETLPEEFYKIYFRKMKSKWASCSSNKGLTFNTSLKYLPDKLVKYVVAHEIAHLKEKRHNERFWKVMSKQFRNREYFEKKLFDYWFLIQKLI